MAIANTDMLDTRQYNTFLDDIALKSEEKRRRDLIEANLALPDIDTSHPKGRIAERPTAIKEVKEILTTVEHGSNSKKYAQAVERKLLDLKPKGLSNSGVPETIEELGEKVLKAESVIDELLDTLPESISESEINILTLTSTIVESVKRLERSNTLGRDKDKATKITSVKMQQDILETLMKYYDHNGFGVFHNLVATAFDISELYLNGKTTGSENRSLVNTRGYIDGIRGMLTTAIMLKDAGLSVFLPDPEDDIYKGCDLVTIINGKKVAISIKAKLGKLEANDRNSLNAKMSYVLNSEFSDAEYLFLEIPNIHDNTSIRRSEFYFDETKTGIPSDLATEWFTKQIELVKERISSNKKLH